MVFVMAADDRRKFLDLTQQLIDIEHANIRDGREECVAMSRGPDRLIPGPQSR